MNERIALPTTPAQRRKGLPILAIVLTTGLAVTVATASFAQGFGPGDGPGYARGMGFGGGPDGSGPGWRQDGPGFWRGGPASFDPARLEARADRMVRHAAVELGANADQQEKLSTIVKAALKDILPVREKLLAARKQGRELLTADKIDRDALEKLRAEQIATHEATSKRLVQALADAAEVLTPEQRKKLDTMIAERRRGRGWGHGWNMGHMMKGWGSWGGWR
ncbi:Spy/CpxP family protein refolding chaperone [Xanthobacteraceae bacterium Astr-EGSB]|uniref:Spy/CpxP family protein refolding chaperone n=1 Tax=Astrobacterium formosum TaxID=3069710 RepID=UPI0027B1918F|nr:Spy/CpxP family protein refolding chaperone [Xanthobacteraceae bacterium Astr-EGSB]